MTINEEQRSLLKRMRDLEQEIRDLCARGDDDSLRQAVETQALLRPLAQRSSDIAVVRRTAFYLAGNAEAVSR